MQAHTFPVLVALLLATASAPAQTVSAGIQRTATLSSFDDPDAKSTVAATKDRLVIEAGDGEGQVALRYARGGAIGTVGENGRRPSDLFGRFAVTVAAPFGESEEGSKDIGSLSGLAADTSATLEGAIYLWPRGNAEPMQAACQRLIPELIRDYTFANVAALTGFVCNEDLLKDGALANLIVSINTSGADCRKPAPLPAKCRKYPGEAVMLDDALGLIKVERGLRDAGIAAFAPMYGVNISLKAGEQSFAFVLPEAPGQNVKTRETAYAASLGFSFVGRTSLWAVGYTYERSFEAASKVMICNPIGTSESLSCSTAHLGAPGEGVRRMAFGETRWLFGRRGQALAPRFEFDLQESSWAVRVPFYLAASKQLGLTFGIALGYSEAADEKFGASLFISRTFDFLAKRP